MTPLGLLLKVADNKSLLSSSKACGLFSLNLITCLDLKLVSFLVLVCGSLVVMCLCFLDSEF